MLHSGRHRAPARTTQGAATQAPPAPQASSHAHRSAPSKQTTVRAKNTQKQSTQAKPHLLLQRLLRLAPPLLPVPVLARLLLCLLQLQHKGGVGMAEGMNGWGRAAAVAVLGLACLPLCVLRQMAGRTGCMSASAEDSRSSNGGSELCTSSSQAPCKFGGSAAVCHKVMHPSVAAASCRAHGCSGRCQCCARLPSAKATAAHLPTPRHGRANGILLLVAALLLLPLLPLLLAAAV